MKSYRKTTAVVTCMTEGDLPYVFDAMRSVISQTEPCRLVVYTNEKFDALNRFPNQTLSHATFRHVPLQPVGSIRNIAAREAETEWVAFLDADDIWARDKNERQLSFAGASGCAAIGCRHILVREDGKPFFHSPTRRTPMPSAMMLRRELLLAEPFLNVPWEDAELWKRPAIQSKAAIMMDFLLYYRIRRVSLSTSFSPAKRRKLFFARLAETPCLRFPLLHVSRVLSMFSKPLLTRSLNHK